MRPSWLAGPLHCPTRPGTTESFVFSIYRLYDGSLGWSYSPVTSSLRAPHTPDEEKSVFEKAAREWLELASKLLFRDEEQQPRADCIDIANHQFRITEMTQSGRSIYFGRPIDTSRSVTKPLANE